MLSRKYMFNPPPNATKSLSVLRRELLQNGYNVILNQSDWRGTKHKYSTSPTTGGGTTNFFDDLEHLEQFAHNVAWVRELEASLPPIGINTVV